MSRYQPRPEVLHLGHAMEAALRANDARPDPQGYTSNELLALFGAKLAKSHNDICKNDYEAVRLHAIDLANYAMFLHSKAETSLAMQQLEGILE